ncbi:TonB family protein [Roseateles sp. BYS96W]|uniref:TonB family protein n=1 Tax=Pelomonas nitida TaxID=3299027 RepID=A0ABW7G681_9BURK
MKPAPPAARAWTLRRCLAASLLAHVLFVLPALAVRARAPAAPRQDKLVVELFGLVAQRQTDEARAGEAAARPAPQARPPQPLQPARRAPSPPPAPPAMVDSPVRVEARPAPADDAPPQAAASATPGPAAQAQVRQTIPHDEPDLDAQRRYLVALKRAVKARLSYPAEANGATGAPVVAFGLRPDGSVEPGSLTIRRSSGNTALDEQALRAVQAVVPFEPPPRAMTIALDIPFAVEQR